MNRRPFAVGKVTLVMVVQSFLLTKMSPLSLAMIHVPLPYVTLAKPVLKKV